MDIRDLVMQNDDALPKLSTATMSAQNNGTLPTFSATPGGLAKFGVSGILSILGMYYLATGKKESDLQKMLLGAAFSLAALFMF